MAKRKFPEKKPVESVETFEAPAVEISEVETPAVEEAAPKSVCASCTATYGVVSGCKMLNVRSKPEISGTIVGMQPEGSTLFINEKKSTNDWYYVSAKGIQGYCMRKYVSVDK